MIRESSSLFDIQMATLFGYQGRSLDPTSKMRYITVMLDEDAPKLYGLEKINTQKPIYILEGPFDSLFVENSIAMCGSDIDIRSFGWSNYIWVFDNEPRNREIVNRIERLHQPWRQSSNLAITHTGERRK